MTFMYKFERPNPEGIFNFYSFCTVHLIDDLRV